MPRRTRCSANGRAPGRARGRRLSTASSVGVANCGAHVGIVRQVPGRVEHRPGNRRLARRLQHFTRRQGGGWHRAASPRCVASVPLSAAFGEQHAVALQRRDLVAPSSRAAPAPRRRPARISAAADACRPACGDSLIGVPRPRYQSSSVTISRCAAVRRGGRFIHRQHRTGRHAAADQLAAPARCRRARRTRRPAPRSARHD